MHGARSSFYYNVPNYDLCAFIGMCVWGGGGGEGVGICACVRVCGRACVPMIISSVTGRVMLGSSLEEKAIWLRSSREYIL